MGKRGVSGDLALTVAVAGPALVDDDVGVAGLGHAAGDHCIGHGANGGVVEVIMELVPAIPAHGRSAREAVVRQIAQLGQGKTAGMRHLLGDALQSAMFHSTAKLVLACGEGCGKFIAAYGGVVYGEPGSDAALQMQLAVMQGAGDGTAAGAGDCLAGLLQFQEADAAIGYAELPVAGHVGLGKRAVVGAEEERAYNRDAMKK